MPETETQNGAATATETDTSTAAESTAAETTDTGASTDNGSAAETKDLGDAGKAAIARERDARRAAEKVAKEAQKRLDAIEAEKLSETDKLKKQAEDGQAAAATAADKLRKANLITALVDEGVTGKQARAAVRLLDGVEFNDDDEPTNLADAIKAAKAEYGEDVFTPRTAAAEAETTDADAVETHAGARQTDASAKPSSTGWFDRKFKSSKT